jgi:phage terminase large subunit-like protein
MWDLIEKTLLQVPEDLTSRQEILRLGGRHSLIAMLKYCNGEDSFVVKPVHRLISKLIEDRIYLRDNTKLNITAPPRCGKSNLAIAALAMVTGLNDESNSIVATAVNDLSKQFYLGYRLLLRNPRFKEIFPEFRGFEVKSSSLVGGGQFKITSPKSSLSGFTAGGNSRSGTVNGILLLDDINSSANVSLIKTANQFLEEQFFRRVAYQGTMRLMIGTVYSKKDSIHTTLDRHGLYSENNVEGWKRYLLPALCEDSTTDLLNREFGESLWEDHATLNRSSLLRLKAQNPEIFQSLFQGSPTDIQSEIVNQSHVSKLLSDTDISTGYLKLYNLVSLDTALGTEFYNDETIITVGDVMMNLATGKIILCVTNQVGGHLPFSETMVKLRELIEPKTKGVIIEQAGSGIIATQQLEQLGNIVITKFKPVKSKEAYLRSVLEIIDERVFFKIGDYYQPLREQLLEFPYFKNDDRLDSFRLLVQEFINQEEKTLKSTSPMVDLYKSFILSA